MTGLSRANQALVCKAGEAATPLPWLVYLGVRPENLCPLPPQASQGPVRDCGARLVKLHTLFHGWPPSWCGIPDPKVLGQPLAFQVRKLFPPFSMLCLSRAGRAGAGVPGQGSCTTILKLTTPRGAGQTLWFQAGETTPFSMVSFSDARPVGPPLPRLFTIGLQAREATHPLQ